MLEAFFPSAPHNERAFSYVSYVSLLQESLDSHAGPYCLRRLIEIYAVEPSDPELTTLLRKHPLGTIKELLNFIIGTSSPLRGPVIISLLDACLQTDGISELGDQLTLLGSSLVFGDQAIFLQTPFEAIPVKITNASVMCTKRLRDWSYSVASVPDEIRDMFL